MSEETVRILVFSDDKDKRAAVINGVGVRASKGHAPHRMGGNSHRLRRARRVRPAGFAALILDAETKKEGGMSVAQDLQETREDVPPIIFLTARAQDEWLATWPAQPPRSRIRSTRSSFRRPSPTCCVEPSDGYAGVGADHRRADRR